MVEAQVYNKGLGNAEVYARIPNGAQFWDFVAAAWVNAETANCRVFMTEFSVNATLSWYYCNLTPPSGGPWPIQIMRLSTGENIGNDFSPITAALVGPGTATCAEIISLVARQLQDTTNITFPAAILLSYLNLAVKEIVNLKPEANSVSEIFALAAGTRQALPTGWNMLIDAKQNMGADGATPGPAIIPIDRQALDTFLPNWPTFPANATVTHIISDDRDPFFFDVFPPQPSVGSTGRILAIGSAFPAKATDPVNDGFPLRDQYMVATVHGMIYWALHEATTIPNALGKATESRQQFFQALGAKGQAEQKVKAEGQ